MLEDDCATLRSIYGFQRQDGFNRWLARQGWLRFLLEDLLGPEVYVYQAKINLKNRLATSVWPYHRDFPFWHVFDGVPECRMVNVAIFLDEVTAECGPLKLLSKSHLNFLPREMQAEPPDYTLQASAGADLAFAFSEEEVHAMRDEFSECSIEGPKGSVLLFHPQTIHGSSASSQDSSRRMLLLTFNACDNLPARPDARPDFLCSRDCRPLSWIH